MTKENKENLRLRSLLLMGRLMPIFFILQICLGKSEDSEIIGRLMPKFLYLLLLYLFRANDNYRKYLSLDSQKLIHQHKKNSKSVSCNKQLQNIWIYYFLFECVLFNCYIVCKPICLGTDN